MKLRIHQTTYSNLQIIRCSDGEKEWSEIVPSFPIVPDEKYSWKMRGSYVRADKVLWFWEREETDEEKEFRIHPENRWIEIKGMAAK